MSDLPRLLFCCFDVVPGPSASSRRLTEYVKGLSERFQVVVLSVKTPDHPHIEKYHGARLLRVPVGAGDLTARAETFDWAVRRQLESEEYVLVHFFDPFGGYALAEKRAELGYTLVYDACVFPSIELPFDSPEPTNRRLTARCRRQELFCLMSSDAVIVGNPLTRDWVSTMGVERERVHVLLAPVDLTPYTPEAMGRPDGRPLRLVHLGSLCGSHGLSVLVEGMALVSPVERARLTLVGPANPQWRARLQHGAATRGLAGLVEFMGPVDHDEIHEVLATADVGALTLDDVERNRVVGSPLSRLGEYLAAGRPVLAADVPSARQLVPPEAAVWYRPSDPKSLADAIIALAADLPDAPRWGPPPEKPPQGGTRPRSAPTWWRSTCRSPASQPAEPSRTMARPSTPTTSPSSVRALLGATCAAVGPTGRWSPERRAPRAASAPTQSSRLPSPSRPSIQSGPPGEPP